MSCHLLLAEARCGLPLRELILLLQSTRHAVYLTWGHGLPTFKVLANLEHYNSVQSEILGIGDRNTPDEWITDLGAMYFSTIGDNNEICHHYFFPLA